MNKFKQLWDSFIRDVKPLKKKDIILDDESLKYFENNPDDVSFEEMISTIDLTIDAPIPDAPKPAVQLPTARRAETSIDLHGMTVHAAYGALSLFISDSKYTPCRSIVVITGRSGQIKTELPRWMESNHNVRSVEELPNQGSFRVWLKR